MLRKILTALGFSSATPPAAAPPYSPYKSDAANAIYNLMFCDDSAAYLAKPDQQPAPWQVVLASNPPEIPALQALAADSTHEGRVRYLAYRELRRAHQSVPTKQLLGVIIELPLSGGLDTLAAYSEGGVRYVNQTGKIVVIEGVPSFIPLVESLLAAAQPVVDVCGPWDKMRLGPPGPGMIRLTFLVSDGLYFGVGPLSVMEQDRFAAPIIQKATELLQAIVAAGT